MEKTVVEIKQLKKLEQHIINDVVICEYPLTIFINDEELITLLCTPMDIKELTFGFLFSEGFINNKEDVKDYQFNQNKGIVRVLLDKNMEMMKKLYGKRARTTGCGKGSIFYQTIDSLKSNKISSNFKLNHERILEMSKDLNKKSALFIETGGVHMTMLVDSNQDIIFYEDVGRHNTVDKIIGYALLNHLNLCHTALFTSGRISSEMLLKALKANIPMIISRSAPTDLAIQLAREYDVSLIGFVRGERMNIYHDANRIT